VPLIVRSSRRCRTFSHISSSIIRSSGTSAVTFKLLLCPGGDDQISHLRRQEALQPTRALDFAYLVGDALSSWRLSSARTWDCTANWSVFSRSSPDGERARRWNACEVREAAQRRLDNFGNCLLRPERPLVPVGQAKLRHFPEIV
jgi:hypothetical protein